MSCGSMPRMAPSRIAAAASRMVREAARVADRCVGILLDLGGPKIRIEGFREGQGHA